MAERAALLADRDDEFTMLVTIGYTGMRWGETIGLERDLLLTGLINVEWQLREVSGRFHRLPPKDDSYRSTKHEPLVPVDLPAVPRRTAGRPGREARRAAMRMRRRARRQRPVRVPRPRRRPPPEQQLRAAGLPPGLRRAASAGQRQRQAGWSSWTPRHGRASRSRRGRQPCPDSRSLLQSGRGTPRLISTENTGRCPSCGYAVRLRLDGRIIAHKTAAGHCPGSGEHARRRRAAGMLAAGQGRADAARPPAQPQDMDGRGRHSRDPGRAAARTPGSRDARPVRPRLAADARELTAALQARWEESLRERAAIDPHSPVPLLDNLLAPFRAVTRSGDQGDEDPAA